MNEKEFIFGMDTVTSHRPYQDVIAINDLSDLVELETRRRRARNERSVHWYEEHADDYPGESKKEFLDRIVSTLGRR